MPSMFRPKSRAARAAAALLSLSLMWQLAAPVTYALAEEAGEVPAIEETAEEALAQEGEADTFPEDSAEDWPSGGQESRPLSAAAPDSDQLCATVKHSGEWGGCSWSIDSDGLLRIWPTDGRSGRLADSRGYDGYFPWYEHAEEVRGVSIDKGVSLPSSATGMFFGCARLTSLDASGWDTSAMTDTDFMFYGCSSLASLDASGWDISAVRSMSCMFRGCSSLASLNASGWDTSAVTNMRSVFEGCSSLSSLDLSRWDTSAATHMSGMFRGCSSLSSLDLSSWDTSATMDMSGMFSGCSGLASLDVSDWDTSAVTHMYSMFSGCSSLATLDVSGWDTSTVTHMYAMFDGCSSLASLDLSGWDTSAARYMSGMFSGCSSLASLDVSGWDTSAVEDMSWMFIDCSSLGSLDLSSWDTSAVTDISSMFSGCDSLARISVGERYDAAKAFPEAPGGGRWRSAATGRTYTAAEVASGRRLVADTYTLAGNTLILATIDAIPDQAYTGKALKPKVTVRLDSGMLVAGTDYTVSYSDNTNVGTATVTVTGKGDYTGAKSASFKVVPASLAKATIAPIPRQLRTGKALEPAVAVTLGGRALVAGTDYTVAYKDNTSVGTATVTVTGKGNYTGTARATFEIVEGPATVEVYRLYNGRTSEHLWTTSANEYKQLPVITKGDWRQEGIAWSAPDGTGTPVYRLYNKKMGDHYYSMDANEVRVLTTQHGWTVDNGGAPAFWSAGKSDPGVSPLFCVYNKRLKKGQHHFTASVAERDFLVANAGWRYEKEAFYGFLK